MLSDGADLSSHSRPAILFAVGYFTYLFWSFRGKVKPTEHGY
jgi:hypothetical protein